jgi:hypothetical protein
MSPRASPQPAVGVAEPVPLGDGVDVLLGLTVPEAVADNDGVLDCDGLDDPELEPVGDGVR